MPTLSATEPDAPLGATPEQIERAMAFVPVVARRYQRRGMPFDELIAAGNLGLVEAALRYDAAHEVKFLTYAIWWIRKNLSDALETQSGPFRLPRHQHQKLRILAEARRHCRHLHGREPGIDELAAELGCSETQCRHWLEASPTVVSLDGPTLIPGDRTLDEQLHDPDETLPEEKTILMDLTRRLRSALRRLAPRDLKLVRLRFGLGDDVPHTLRETGRLLGLSRERIRQIEIRLLQELRLRL